VPIDLVLSCRKDDVLLLPQIAEWCREGAAAAAAAAAAADDDFENSKNEGVVRLCTV
jgi:hypothetical protein